MKLYRLKLEATWLDCNNIESDLSDKGTISNSRCFFDVGMMWADMEDSRANPIVYKVYQEMSLSNGSLSYGVYGSEMVSIDYCHNRGVTPNSKVG